MQNTVTIRISPLFFALLATLLLYEEKGLAAGCLAASFLHECGHLLMMFWRKSPPVHIAVGAFGMRIERRDGVSLSFADDICIAAGGPLVNGICFAAFWWLGKTTAAVIHLLLFCLNMLPITALDGGQMLLCTLYRFLSKEQAERVVFICSLAVIFPLGALGFWVLLQSGCNVSLLAVDAYLILLLFFKRND